jgi:hypothetical protein
VRHLLCETGAKREELLAFVERGYEIRAGQHHLFELLHDVYELIITFLSLFSFLYLIKLNHLNQPSI